MTYFRLNNEINRPVNGQIMLHKDKEALDAFFKENVDSKHYGFDSITDKSTTLLNITHRNCILKKYRQSFGGHQFIKDQNFQFRSFMAAYKFYNQCALKTSWRWILRLKAWKTIVFFNALSFANGDEAIATIVPMKSANATNQLLASLLECWSPSWEFEIHLVSWSTDDMNSIGRSINSALQLTSVVNCGEFP